MAFRPVTIPLLKGQDQGTADFALAQQDLISATNVVFTKQGAIRGRPGTVSLNGQVIAYDKVPVSDAGSLATALSNYQPAGLHVDAQGGTLLQTHGRMFRRAPGSTQWLDVGPMWSMRRLTYSPAGNYTLLDQGGSQVTNDVLTAAVDMGVNISGIQVASGVTSANLATGFAVYNSDGTILGPRSPGAAASNLQDHRGVSVANSAVFFIDSGTITSLKCQMPGATPLAGTNFTLAADATANAYTALNQQRVWAAWDGTNYYVAYIAGTSPNDTIKILKVSPAGAVLNTLTYAPLTTINSVCISVDATSGLGLLCFTCTTGSQVRSQVFSLSGLTDSAIGTARTPANTAGTVGAVCGIKGTSGYLAWHGHPQNGTNNGFSTLELSVRSMTAATDTLVAVYGQGPAPTGVTLQYTDLSKPTVAWMIVFPPTLVAGRMLMGVQHGQRNASNGTTSPSPCTWVILDITDADGVGYPSVVAAGELGDCAPVSRAASCAVINGSLLFGIPQGINFTATGITQATFTPILLTPQAAPSTQSGQHLLMGGTLLSSYEGNHVAELGWVQGQPVISSVAYVSVGGFTTGTSYTFSAVWVYTDALGQRQRSIPAAIQTAATGAGGGQASIVITNPLITNKGQVSPSFTYSSVVLEVYCSQANPAANSPLYLATTIAIDPRPSGTSNATTTVQLVGPPALTAAQMYTTGNVLADERPGGSDRGVTVVGHRVWTADERFLYASHVRSPNISPAFNNEIFYVLVPEVYGPVQGICAVDDKVAAVCQRGVLLVNGPGFDDSGSGPGWSEPHRIGNIGGCGPARTVCSHPQGGAFVGVDGLLYGISRADVVQCLGQAVRDSAETTGDLVYVPPGSNIGWDVASNPLLVYGTTNLKVVDLTNGQWATWTGLTATSLVGTPTGLQAMISASPYVVQFSASGGQDLGANFSMSVRLAPQETTQEGLMSGWGRVQSVNPVFKSLAPHNIAVQAYADEEQVKILDKSFNVPA